MHQEVPISIKAEDLPQGLWDLLRSVQLRASRHLRQPRRLPLLRPDDDSRWPEEVPMKLTYIATKCMPQYRWDEIDTL